MLFILISCQHSGKEFKEDVSEMSSVLKPVKERYYNTIPPFRFVDQDSLLVTEQDAKGKIVVADFFFSSCPTICPVMKSQMQRVYRKFHNHPDILLLSHTIDPQTDSVKVLKKLATKLGVNDRKWLFLTGSKHSLHRIAKESYYLSAMDDKEAPGGKLHSGKFVLLDENQQIRGYYDGTDAEEVDLLVADIKILLQEKNQ